MRLVSLVIMLAVVATLGAPDLGAAGPPLATAETLVGTWNGRWVVEGHNAEGSAGLVLARVPGRSELVGQFTFVTGAKTKTMRYEGQIENGRLEFPLVGDGRIVLAPVGAVGPGAAPQLRGEWTDERGALPAPQGVIELRRAK